MILMWFYFNDFHFIFETLLYNTLRWSVIFTFRWLWKVNLRGAETSASALCWWESCNMTWWYEQIKSSEKKHRERERERDLRCHVHSDSAHWRKRQNNSLHWQWKRLFFKCKFNNSFYAHFTLKHNAIQCKMLKYRWNTFLINTKNTFILKHCIVLYCLRILGQIIFKIITTKLGESPLWETQIMQYYKCINHRRNDNLLK